MSRRWRHPLMAMALHGAVQVLRLPSPAELEALE
jgi:hypothetical protein